MTTDPNSFSLGVLILILVGGFVGIFVIMTGMYLSRKCKGTSDASINDVVNDFFCFLRSNPHYELD